MKSYAVKVLVNVFGRQFKQIIHSFNYRICKLALESNFFFFPGRFIFLFLENYGIRKLEAFFGFLISIMAISFAWMFGKAQPSASDLALGESLMFLLTSASLAKSL